MAPSILLASRSNIKAAILCALLAASARAQLPDGPGKAETEKLCSQCHELSQAISLRQDRAGWQATISKMVNLGAKATDVEIQLVTNYLSKNFPAEDVPHIHVNTARAIEFEAGLSMRRSQAASLIAYRTKHGPFKSIKDLEKVPGIDVQKIEARKDRLLFDENP